jgi:stress response protein SCP2
LIAVLQRADGRVRSDDDLVFFNNPVAHGVRLNGDGSFDVDLAAVPADIDRVVLAASTEAQGLTFGQVPRVFASIRGVRDDLRFDPPGLADETLLILVAFYRRAGTWKLDAIGQGYAAGLAAFATECGISVDDAPPPAATPPPAPPSAPPVDLRKVKVSITKDSVDKTARIDLRKSQGDPSYVLTVGLEWDGRGAVYAKDGTVKKYGEGDLDVYFFCRNEETHEFVVLSGERGHTGGLKTWPFIQHHGDSLGPGKGGRAAVEQVTVLPQENGDLLVNVYQSVDNGAGAINTFGRPRVAIRYGRVGAGGLPGPDADEILVYVGNDVDSYWATVAHIDVEGGVLTVDGATRYSEPGSETMPTLDRRGDWVAYAPEAPTGQSKKEHGRGLDLYCGKL